MNKRIFIIFAMVKLIGTPAVHAGAFSRSLRNAWHTVETHAPQLRTELNQAAQRVRQEAQALRENISPAVRNSASNPNALPHSLPQGPLRPYHGPTPVNSFVRTAAPSPFFHSLRTPLPGHFHSSFATPLSVSAPTSSLLVGRMTNEQFEALLNNTPTPQQQEQPLAFTGFTQEDNESSDTLVRPLNDELSDLSFSKETHSPETTNLKLDVTDQPNLDDAISTLEHQIAEIDAQLEQEEFHPRTFSNEEALLFNQEEEPFSTLIPENPSIVYENNNQTTVPPTDALTVYDAPPSEIAPLPEHASSALTVISAQEASTLVPLNNQSRALTTIYEEEESALVAVQNNEFEDLGDIFTLLFKEEPVQSVPNNQQPPLLIPAGTTPLMLTPGTTPLLLSAGEPAVTQPVAPTRTLETIIEENAPFEAQNQLNNLTNASVTNPFLVPALFTAAIAAATVRKKPVNTAALQQALTAGRTASLPHGTKPAVRAHIYKQVVRTSPSSSLSAKPKTNNYRLPTSLEQAKPKKPASTNFYKVPSLKPSSQPNTTPSQIYRTPVQPAAPQPVLESLAPQRYVVKPVTRTVIERVEPSLRTTLPEPIRTQKITLTPEQPSQANVYRIPTEPQPAPQTRAVPETTPSTTATTSTVPETALIVQPTRPIPAPRANINQTPTTGPTVQPQSFLQRMGLLPKAAPRNLSNPAVRSITTNAPSLIRPLAQARLPQPSLRNFSTAPTIVPPTPAARAPFPDRTPPPVAAPRVLPRLPALGKTPTPAPKPAKRKKLAPAKTPKQEESLESEDVVPPKKQDKPVEADTDSKSIQSPTKEVPLTQEKEAPAPLQNIQQPEVTAPTTVPGAPKNGSKSIEPYELMLRQGKTAPVFVQGKDSGSTSKNTSTSTTASVQKAMSSPSLTVRSGLGKEVTPSTPSKKSAEPQNSIFEQPRVKGSPRVERKAPDTISALNPVNKRNDSIEHSLIKEAKPLKTDGQKIVASAQTIGSFISHAVSSFTTYILKGVRSLKSLFQF